MYIWNNVPTPANEKWAKTTMYSVYRKCRKQGFTSYLTYNRWFGDESLQAMNCNGSDNQTHNKHDKIHKKLTLTNETGQLKN